MKRFLARDRQLQNMREGRKPSLSAMISEVATNCSIV